VLLINKLDKALLRQRYLCSCVVLSSDNQNQMMTMSVKNNILFICLNKKINTMIRNLSLVFCFFPPKHSRSFDFYPFHLVILHHHFLCEEATQPPSHVSIKIFFPSLPFSNLAYHNQITTLHPHTYISKITYTLPSRPKIFYKTISKQLLHCDSTYCTYRNVPARRNEA
jgi:hypothetical protein